MYVAENVLLIFAHVELYSACESVCSYVTQLDLTVNYRRDGLEKEKTSFNQMDTGQPLRMELWTFEGDREDAEMRSQARKMAHPYPFSIYTQMRTISLCIISSMLFCLLFNQ